MNKVRKKSVYIIIISAVLGLCCAFGVFFLRNIHSGGSGSSSDSAHTVFRTNLEQELSLEKGGCTVFEISSDDEAALSRWQSSDSSTVSVDSGGRIDAHKKGSATVSAHFIDGHVYTYRVTVSDEKKPQVDVYSTAITANEDILKKNLKENPPKAVEPATEEGSSDDDPGFYYYYDDDTDGEYYDYDDEDEDDEYDEYYHDDDESFEETAFKNMSKPTSGLLPYEVRVNRKQNCVTVFTYDSNGEYTVPVRAMVCSCGKNEGTITGEFTIYLKTLWHPLVNGVFGQYISGFSGDYLFHSVPYNDLAKNTLETDEFNKLGEAASQGCVRLAVSDARWIYENCGEGTTVKIFDSDEKLPLGKPAAIRIGGSDEGWDPTDRDEANPFNGKTPEISGAEDVTISVGSDYKMSDGVTALNSCGADATKEIEIIGNVVTSRAGVYKVTYRVTDALHRTAHKDIIVTVQG